MLGKALIGLLVVSGLSVLYLLLTSRKASASDASPYVAGKWNPGVYENTPGLISSASGDTYKPPRGGIIEAYVKAPTQSNAGAPNNKALAAATNRAKSRAVRGGY